MKTVANQTVEKKSKEWLIDGVLPRVGLVSLIGRNDAQPFLLARDLAFALDRRTVDPTWAGREIPHRPAALCFGELGGWFANPPHIDRSTAIVKAVRDDSEIPGFVEFLAHTGTGLVVLDGLHSLACVSRAAMTAETRRNTMARLRRIAREAQVCILLAESAEYGPGTDESTPFALSPTRHDDHYELLVLNGKPIARFGYQVELVGEDFGVLDPLLDVTAAWELPLSDLEDAA